MKILFNKRSQALKSKAFVLAAGVALVLGLTGCGGEGADSGEVSNTVDLPLDYALNLYCPEMGIADEKCILNDPDNAYARSIINDVTKWDLAGNSPSAKSDFYLWGTAQAKSPRGENQYYTAVALHKLFTQGSSELAREQAKKAYRSVLDNYFGSVTFYTFNTPTGELVIPQSLRNLVGDNLYNPGGNNLSQLYDSQARVLEAFGEWGYFYDTSNGLITKSE